MPAWVAGILTFGSWQQQSAGRHGYPGDSNRSAGHGYGSEMDAGIKHARVQVVAAGERGDAQPEQLVLSPAHPNVTCTRRNMMPPAFTNLQCSPSSVLTTGADAGKVVSFAGCCRLL